MVRYFLLVHVSVSIQYTTLRFRTAKILERLSQARRNAAAPDYLPTFTLLRPNTLKRTGVHSSRALQEAGKDSF